MNPEPAKLRMHFLQRWPGMVNFIGLGIASGGLLLSLPLPPPATASTGCGSTLGGEKRTRCRPPQVS